MTSPESAPPLWWWLPTAGVVWTAQRRCPPFSWCEHMNVTLSRADVLKHKTSPVCVYLPVSAVEVAVVLPVEGAVDRAVLFSS